MQTNSSVDFDLSMAAFADGTSAVPGSNTSFVVDKMSYEVTLVMRTTSMSTIVLNVYVLMCLFVKKTSVPRVYWVQLTCLTVNDVIAGMSIFLVSFVDARVFTESLTLCYGTLTLFFSSQVAILYSIFIICIRRFQMVSSARKVQADLNGRTFAMISSLIWLLSYGGCLAPFLVWGRRDVWYLKGGCGLETVFGDNMRNTMTVFFATYIVPLMFTNAMYVIVLMMLRGIWSSRDEAFRKQKGQNGHQRRPNDSQQTNAPLIHVSDNDVDDSIRVRRFKEVIDIDISSNAEETSFTVVKRTNNESFVSLYPDQDTSVDETSLLTSKSVCITEAKQSKRTDLQTVESSLVFAIGVSSTSRDACTQTSTDSAAKPRHDARCNSENGARNIKHKSTRHSISAKQVSSYLVKRQRKAYTLLGVILIFLNVFTWPAIVVLIMESKLQSWSVPRSVKLPMFTTISINSLVNPILYAVQVKEFRRALRDTFTLNITRCKKK